MKIAFVGKGGSGKTTASALFARYLADCSYPILAIDADINQHLGRALGLSSDTTLPYETLGQALPRIKDYLRGINTRILTPETMIKTTPPGQGSRLMTLSPENPLLRSLEHRKHGLRFIPVGAFEETDLGTTCYHSKTGAVELLLNHLVDGPNEYVVVDMTAGADAFASGLFTRFDLTLLVVEPTQQSIAVYQQYLSYAKRYDVVIKVLGNKVEDANDIAFIRSAVGDNLVATLSRSSFVKAFDRGNVLPFSSLEEENLVALETIRGILEEQKKDWKKYFDDAVAMHIQNAVSWANAAACEDLREQIDPTFVYPARSAVPSF